MSEDPLELELQMLVSHHVGVGNLWSSAKMLRSQQLSHLSSPEDHPPLKTEPE